MSDQDGTERGGFVKALTLTDATMLVAGSMVGSGIFIVSADIARTVGSPYMLLMAWLVTGLMTMLGALAYGELAAMYPKAGGQYVFLREALGPLIGFLYGWTLFLIIQTGTIAAVAVAFGRFLGVLVPSIGPERFSWFPSADLTLAGSTVELGLSPQRLVALISIWVLTWINLRGVKEGKFVQTTLTVIKTTMLAALVILGVTIGRNADALAANFGAGQFMGTTSFMSILTLGFGTALVGSLFSSDAWNNVTFAAAEVKNPAKNLPLALVLGTGLITLLYITANIAYLNALPFEAIKTAAQDRVGTAMMQGIFGPVGGTIMAVGILLSAFGCNNGLILSGARVYWAMAKDGLFFQRVGTLSDRGVPAWGLLAQSIWTSILCLTGTYGQLLDYVIFAALVFYALTTIGLFILRAKRPEAPRPYRAVGYPYLPALYIALSSGVAVVLLIADKTRAQALAGLAIVLLGIPVYLFWRRSAPSQG
ncbi:MAG: amino acid permease [Gemmatimonadaceae bacterium]|nr:amino acid permease [Gemmatimonadaceae bacterium]